MRSNCFRFAAPLALWWACWLVHGAGTPPERAPDYDWFSMPITVKGLPPGAGPVPVSQTIDLTRALERLAVSGAADERSFRLYRIRDGSEIDEPVQFRANPQPRLPDRKLLPGTPPSVSYLGEFAAGHTPAGLTVAGPLTWMAHADETGRAEYRLEFGVLRTGRAVQVPFSPQNLRMFDGEGQASPTRWFPQMQIRPQWPVHGQLRIFDQNELVTVYHLGPAPGAATPATRRPFLYPLNGPDGVSLTEFGKPHDPTGSHAHHYSLWIAHANVNGTDFWSEKGGLIVHEQLELLEDGPVLCRVVEKTRWLNGTAAVLLERRQFTFYRAAADFRLIDLDLQFTPAGSEPVLFGQTSFGFLAARVAQSMTVFDGAGEILNAEGDRNEQGAHLKRASWIDQSGPIAPGQWNGLAIFDHPDNPNHPSGWHCRNDGWAGAAFNLGNPWTLQPGEALRLRYRIHLHRHNAIQGAVAGRYHEYAARAVVHVGEAIAGRR